MHPFSSVELVNHPQITQIAEISQRNHRRFTERYSRQRRDLVQALSIILDVWISGEPLPHTGRRSRLWMVHQVRRISVL